MIEKYFGDRKIMLTGKQKHVEKIITLLFAKFYFPPI